MKRKLLLALAATMTMAALLALSGCTRGDQGAQPGRQAGEAFVSHPNLNPLGMLPLTQERETLRVVYSRAGDLPENYMAMRMTEEMGIDFDWLNIPVDAFRERVVLMFASSEEIDLIVSPNAAAARFNRMEEFRFVTQGLLTPLNDFINYSSYFIRPIFEEHPQFWAAGTTPDGNIYTIPSLSIPGVSGAFHSTASFKMWVNYDWLTRLNMPIPTCTEEFYEMLVAFRDLDANGSGDPSTQIPFSTIMVGPATQIDGFLMNAFTFNDPRPYTNAQRLRVNAEGRVEASFMCPGYREGLRYLHRLFAAGLIWPDSFTQDRATQHALNDAGDFTRIGALPGQHAGLLTASLGASDRWMEYVIIPPLRGPDGFVVTPTDHHTGNSHANGMIPVTSRNPELAFRLMDVLHDEYWTLRMNWGPYGYAWRTAEPGELGADGRQAQFANFPMPQDHPFFGNQHLHGWPGAPITHTGVARSQDPRAPAGQGHEVVLYRGTLAYVPYLVNQRYIVPAFYYLEDEISQVSVLAATINPFVEENIVRFVTGDRCLDTQWDSFLQDLQRIGIDQYLALVQAGYDRWRELTGN